MLRMLRRLIEIFLFTIFEKANVEIKGKVEGLASFSRHLNIYSRKKNSKHHFHSTPIHYQLFPTTTSTSKCQEQFRD